MFQTPRAFPPLVPLSPYFWPVPGPLTLYLFPPLPQFHPPGDLTPIWYPLHRIDLECHILPNDCWCDKWWLKRTLSGSRWLIRHSHVHSHPFQKQGTMGKHPITGRHSYNILQPSSEFHALISQLISQLISHAKQCSVIHLVMPSQAQQILLEVDELSQEMESNSFLIVLITPLV
jgi:hypothetical protein